MIGRRSAAGGPGRRGYSLLEVVVAMAILVTSLVILIEIQGTAVEMTTTAEHIVTATQLAQEKLTEVRLIVETEGITEEERSEEGDFDDFGDEQLDLEFGRQLDAYHWEWVVAEVDIGLAGDIAGMAQDLAGSGLVPGLEGRDEVAGEPGEGLGLQDQSPDLSSLGIDNDMITEMLGRYIREIRVTVWWGDDRREATERGDFVTITAHAVDPAGSYVNLTQQGQGLPQ